jgi:hypothetical protein
MATCLLPKTLTVLTLLVVPRHALMCAHDHARTTQKGLPAPPAQFYSYVKNGTLPSFL